MITAFILILLSTLWPSRMSLRNFTDGFRKMKLSGISPTGQFCRSLEWTEELMTGVCYSCPSLMAFKFSFLYSIFLKEMVVGEAEVQTLLKPSASFTLSSSSLIPALDSRYDLLHGGEIPGGR